MSLAAGPANRLAMLCCSGRHVGLWEKCARHLACWGLLLGLKHWQTQVERLQPWVIKHPCWHGQGRWGSCIQRCSCAEQGYRMARHQGGAALR